jgi:hypothetical protein
MTTQTGFRQDNLGSYIDKDPGATLVYSLDWADWMESGDALANSTMTTTTISGDPSPLTIVSSGIRPDVDITYVEITGGSAGNIYTITNTITTENGLIDRRAFRIRVQTRFL